MKNFKDGFSDFKKSGNDAGGRPKFGFASGAGRKSSGQHHNFTKPRFEKRGNERQFGRGNDRTTGEMFTATCSSCLKRCEVPFRPNGEKPVYCSACFGVMRDSVERSGDRNTIRREDTSYVKSDRQTPILDQVRPREERSKDLEAIKAHLAKIELQLNRVLEFVNPPVSARATSQVAKESTNLPEEVTSPTLSKRVAAKKTVKTKTVVKSTKKTVVKKTSKKVAKKVVKKAVKKTA